MKDIEKEMLDAILSPLLNYNEAAAACFEIHRREMEFLLKDLNKCAGSNTMEEPKIAIIGAGEIAKMRSDIYWAGKGIKIMVVDGGDKYPLTQAVLEKMAEEEFHPIYDKPRSLPIINYHPEIYNAIPPPTGQEKRRENRKKSRKKLKNKKL